MRHISTKFILRAVSVLILITVLSALFNIFNKKQLLEENIAQKINSETNSLSNLLSESASNIDSKLQGALSLLHHETILLQGQPVLNGTAELNGQIVPQLFFGTTPVAGNYTAVDLVKESCHSTATVFARDVNDDFVRIATNVPSKADPNKRAVGTLLNRTGAAYAKIMAGEQYAGMVMIQGKNYLTIYDPIKNIEGDIVGILYVGVQVTSLEALHEIIKNESILESGFFALIKDEKVLLAPESSSTKEMMDITEIQALQQDKNWVAQSTYNGIADVTILAMYPIKEYKAGINNAIFINLMLLIANIILIWVVLYFDLKALIIKPLSKVEQAAQHIADGNNEFKLDLSDSIEFDSLSKSFNKITNAITEMIDEVQTINDNCLSGNLDYRGDESKYHGGYRSVISGFNSTLDDVVVPMQLASERVIEIVDGKKTTTVDDPKFKNNPVVIAINNMIGNNNELFDNCSIAAKEIRAGNTTYRPDIANAPKGIQTFLTGVSNIMEAFREPMEVVLDYADKLAQGILPEIITGEFKGDFNKLKVNFNSCTTAISNLVDETKHFVEMSISGQLSMHADVNKHQGEFKQIVQGFNDAMGAIVNQVALSAEYIDRIAKGDIPPIITDKWSGDFNEIRTNINLLIESLTVLTGMINSMVHSSKQGRFSYRNDVSTLNNQYKVLGTGLNEVLNVFTDFFDSLPIIVIATDTQGKMTYTNQTAINATGLSLEAIIGKTNEEIFNTGKSNNDGTSIMKAMKNNAIQTGAGTCKPGIKSAIDIEFQVAPLTDNGNIVGSIAFISDVTAIKKQSRVSTKINTYIATEIHEMIEVYSALADGDFSKRYKITNPDEDTQSSFEMLFAIDQSIYKLSKVFGKLSKEINSLVDAAIDGNLKEKADAEGFNGVYKNIIYSMNKLMQVITSPIDEAGEILSAMAKGDLCVRMHGDYKGEFNRLKRNINTLGESLNSLLSEIVNTVDITSVSAHDITHAAILLAASSQEQTSQAEDVAQATEVMARTVTENAQASVRTAEMANASANTAKESSEVVALTVMKMGDIAKVVRISAENIEKLGESSKSIGEIVGVIDDIADQTNLLALNASIEAARAGEQGRGFAVVADEVRKLAEKTVEATKEISQQIKRIQAETQAAVLSMKQGTEEVDAGIALTDKSGIALKEIMLASEEVTAMVNEIAQASDSQAAATEQISKNVISISEVSADSSKQVEGVSHNAEHLTELTEKLSAMVSQFKINKDCKKKHLLSK